MDIPNYRQDTVDRIQAYCATHGISEGAFGRLVMDDYRFVERVRDGAATVRTIEKAERVMSAPPPPRGRGKNAAAAGQVA